MEEKKEKVLSEILPPAGIWTVESLAAFLRMDPGAVQQKLSDAGIKVLSFSNRYRAKLVRLEDLKG